MNDAFRFPALHHLCGAYLNRDWPDEYGSVEEAVRAFARETTAARRSTAAAEADELLHAPPESVLAALTTLGCAYAFADSADAVAFLAGVRVNLR